VRPLRERHPRGGPEQVGIAAGGPDAGIDILVRHAKEAEGGRGERLRRGERGRRPDVRRRIPVLADGHRDGFRRQRLPGDVRRLHDVRNDGLGAFLRRRGGVVAGGRIGGDVGQRRLRRRGQRGHEAADEFPLGQSPAPDADIVEQAAVAAARIAPDRRADPDGAVVDHGRLRRGPAHVPAAPDGHAVDDGQDAVGPAELVGQRDMVPAIIRPQSPLRGPPPPLHAAASRWRGEEKARAGEPLHFTEPQRPVLVVRRRGPGVGAALADEVDVVSRPHPVGLYPRLERDRVAIGEIEDALLAGIREHHAAPVAAEPPRPIGPGKGRKVGTPRPGQAGLHAADELEAVGNLGIEEPLRGGNGAGRRRVADAREQGESHRSDQGVARSCRHDAIRGGRHRARSRPGVSLKLRGWSIEPRPSRGGDAAVSGGLDPLRVGGPPACELS